MLPRPGDKESLLPFWTTFFEPACPNSQFPSIPYLLVDDSCIGSPCLAVWSQAHQKGTYVPFAGRYTLHIQGPQFCQEDVPSATGIQQRATIPADARSLSFLANISGMLQIKINGQTVRAVPQETFARYTRYAVDVSAHAGLEVDLSFSAVPTPQWPSFVGRLPNQTLFELDDLRFGPEPVQFADGPGTMMLSPGTVANSWIVGFTGVLEYSGNPEGPWIPVEGLLSPLELVPRSGPEVLFLRARAWP